MFNECDKRDFILRLFRAQIKYIDLKRENPAIQFPSQNGFLFQKKNDDWSDIG